jgi:oxygen-independent coproporphyrinogen-3 oxidase
MMAKDDKKSDYIKALKKELLFHRDKYNNIKTIYIGGGTPSSLDNSLLEELLIEISNVVDLSKVIEYTIETNPSDINREKLELFKKYGVTRISMGVQTFNDSQLVFLNRDHKEQDIEKAILLLKEFGFDINVDMIFSLVNQDIKELEYDIDKVLELDVDHISYYSLILEEKTKLMYLYNMGKVRMNSEEKEALMYNMVLDRMIDAGYEHYEISNFARNKKYSRHNMVYWKNEEYLGIGTFAHSLYEDRRFYGLNSVKRYTELIFNDDMNIYTMYERNALEEELIMGLRLLKGIDVDAVNQKYNIDLFDKYDKLHVFIENGLVEYSDGYLRLSKKGLFVGNMIFEVFLEG